VLADGGYQQLYRSQVQPVPHHESVVIAKAKHFVMLDDPDAMAKAIDGFVDKLSGGARK